MVTNKYIFFLLLRFAGKIARKIVEDKTDSLLWNRLYKTFENMDREWKYGNVYGRSYNESKYFSFNSTVAQL